MGDELVAEGVSILVRHIVQQSFHSPCHVQLAGAFEVRALGCIDRNAVGIDDAQSGVLRGTVFCNQMMQAFLAPGTLAVDCLLYTSDAADE